MQKRHVVLCAFFQINSNITYELLQIIAGSLWFLSLRQYFQNISIMLMHSKGFRVQPNSNEDVIFESLTTAGIFEEVLATCSFL